MKHSDAMLGIEWFESQGEVNACLRNLSFYATVNHKHEEKNTSDSC